jgi:uroporphyrinogen-III synthase
MQAMDKHAKPCGWTFVSLRPQGQHAALRVALAHSGACTVGLSPWRLQRRPDAAGAGALRTALQASAVIFTSPGAVAAAASFGDTFLNAPERPWLAVGDGTLRALRAHGIDHAIAPSRMDSEGLLALPVLADVQGKAIGLVTAPGGRGLIAADLQARGAQLRRADVYRRVPLRLPARALARLSRSPRPWVLGVSSGEALERVWAQLSPPWRARWQADMAMVVASERLAVQARALGLAPLRVAAGPTAAQMAAAAVALHADMKQTR